MKIPQRYLTLLFLDHIETTCRVNKQRIYVTGLKMGGYGTRSLALCDTDRRAASAPISGGGNAIAARYIDSISTPAWTFHGSQDPTVPVRKSEEMINVLKNNKVEARLTVYEDAGQDAWSKTYANKQLYQWLLAHQREN